MRKTTTVVLFALATVLAACGGTEPPATSSTTGSGGSGGATTTTSSTYTPGEAWKAGLTDCTVLEPMVASGDNPRIIFQRLRPTGRLVEKIGTTVARDDGSGPAGATGGPYRVVWATGPADGTLPASPRIWEEKSVAESDMFWASPQVGFTDFILDVPVLLLADEVLWVGAALDEQDPAPSSALLCADVGAAGAEDTVAASGACPGAGCTTGPVPAAFKGMAALNIARGH